MKIRRIVTRIESVVSESPHGYGTQVLTLDNAATIFQAIIGAEAVEVFAAVALDAKHCVIGYYEVSRGTLTSSLVHPREVFAPALRLNAAAIVVAHNHPSGNLEASPEDVAVTARLQEAGKLLGVPCLDSLIITTESYSRISSSV